jgi:Domain of unknown function (DUF4259)
MRMGAWGAGPFENDDASDWVYELEEAPDLNFVRDVLRSVVDATGYLDAPDGSIGLAAAEVVAAAHGHPTGALPESVTTWAAAHGSQVSNDDLMLAVAAVDRIVSDDSELRDLWEDAADAGWATSVQELRQRLTA